MRALIGSLCFLLVVGCGEAPSRPGAEDAGTPDAGTPDAGSPDAGPSDAGLADAGTATVTAERFADAVAYSDAVSGDALLVMEHGVVTFEHYVAPTTASTFHPLASGTKSFTCALYALGSSKGYWTLETRAADIITEWQTVPRKQDILLKHLLSLSSGLSEAPGYSPLTVRTLDTYSMGINDTIASAAPDQAAIYTPTTFQVMAAMLERKNGGVDPVAVLEANVFSKLGIAPDASHDTASRWTRDKQGKPQMAGGASLTAREWARYGVLMANHGSWNGEQVLDAARVDECWSYRPPAFLGYGLTWWLNRPNEGTYDPSVDRLPPDGLGDGLQLASNAPADLAVAAGAGKQRLYVIRSLDLVIVRYGRNDASFSDHQLLGALLGTP